MRKIFVVSDTHFGHSNILNFMDKDGHRFRGSLFSSVQEMNETMVENWNSVVSDQDIVYHMGDVYFGNPKDAEKYISRLNGRKRLLLGNHDDGKCAVLQKHFQKIGLWRMFPEFNVLLTHVPVHESTLNEKKSRFNLHGHIHQNDSPSPLHINCCVEKHGYTPVELESLIPAF